VAFRGRRGFWVVGGVGSKTRQTVTVGSASEAAIVWSPVNKWFRIRRRRLPGIAEIHPSRRASRMWVLRTPPAGSSPNPPHGLKSGEQLIGVDSETTKTHGELLGGHPLPPRNDRLFEGGNVGDHADWQVVRTVGAVSLVGLVLCTGQYGVPENKMVLDTADRGANISARHAPTERQSQGGHADWLSVEPTSLLVKAKNQRQETSRLDPTWTLGQRRPILIPLVRYIRTKRRKSKGESWLN
jgi:hypothetical protein